MNHFKENCRAECERQTSRMQAFAKELTPEDIFDVDLEVLFEIAEKEYKEVLKTAIELKDKLEKEKDEDRAKKKKVIEEAAQMTASEVIEAAVTSIMKKKKQDQATAGPRLHEAAGVGHRHLRQVHGRVGG